VYSLVENFSASFTAVDTISGLRGLFTFGIAMGGPQAYWSTFLISAVFILMTSAVLAETCSALPAAGSIYLWAAASGGPKFGRLFGTIVAFWSSMAWISFVASNSQVAAMYMFSEVSVFGLDFNTSTTNVKYRAAEWIVAEVILVICLLINYLPSRMYKYVFRVAMGIVILDTLLNLIWLPIGVSKTYGFQDATFVFTNYENYTGLPNTWAWMLCFFATGGVQIGFDASGHVAEETKNASLVAARGLIS
jgi:amino acid transporter